MTSRADASADAMHPVTAEEEVVVRSLPCLVYALPRAIDADMMREQRLSNTEYLTVMHLSEAPGRQLRMGELAHACEMSLSGTTRVVQRLESEGFIQRVRRARDGRSWHAVPRQRSDRARTAPQNGPRSAGTAGRHHGTRQRRSPP